MLIKPLSIYKYCYGTGKTAVMVDVMVDIELT